MTGDITADGDLSITGDTAITGDLTVSGDITAEDITASGTIYGDLANTGYIDGDLEVTGKIIAHDVSTLPSILTSNIGSIRTSPTAIEIGSNVYVAEALTTEGVLRSNTKVTAPLIEQDPPATP